MANAALNKILIEAARKALSGDLPSLFPKAALKKLSPAVPSAPFDESLLEFYVPGRTRRGDPTEEQKMIAGLRVLVKKLETENKSLRAELPPAKEKSYQQGLADGQAAGERTGFERGRSQGLAGLSKLQENLSRVLQSLESQKAAIFKGSERKLLELAFLTAGKIIEKEAATQREIVLEVVKRAVAEVASADRLLIKVNPKELAHVEEAKDFWMPVHKALSDLRVESDSRVEPGGCIVETPSGSVDARPSVKLERIKEIFLKCWEEAEPSPPDAPRS